MNTHYHIALYNYLEETQFKWKMTNANGSVAFFGVGFKAVKDNKGIIRIFNTKGHEHYPQMGLSELSKIWDEILKKQK